MFRNKLVSAIVFTVSLLAYSLHAAAQTQVYEVMFQNNKVALNDNGERDTISVIDPVMGDTTLKILPVLYPIRINGSATSAEKSPFPISALLQKKLAAELGKPEYLKSIFDGKPIPDGVLILGLNNIVVTPDGSVVYYNLYKTEYYIEKESITRTIALKKDVEKILEDSGILFKQKFKEPYLVLNGNMTTMTFRVHDGVIKH